MNESSIDVRTADGVMVTRTFAPAGGGPFPVVIFYMDGLGVREVLAEMARRIAAEGYFVTMPNLFYRSGPYAPFDGASVFGNPDERARIMALIREVTPARVSADTTALLEALAAQPAADTRRIGTVGYCMGGGPALAAAGRFPDRVRAAASYHGGNIATDALDSPHAIATQARGELYVGYAENDNSFPDEQLTRLRTAFDAAHVRYSAELYHGLHGFAVRDLPPFKPDAAERHWATLLGLFHRTLDAA